MPKRLSTDLYHWLLVYPNPPGAQELQALEAKRVQVVQFVPERGLIAAVADGTVLDELGIESQALVPAELKISPALVSAGIRGEGTTPLAILLEFYPGIARTDMARIALLEQVEVIENPDLVGWQMLVRAAPGRLAQLAQWDEVAYLFPSSPELNNGHPTEACHGALGAVGPIGQITAKVGNGWDGAGLNSVDLGYFFTSYTGRISPDRIRSEVLRAMGEWSKYVKVRFSGTSSATATRSIHILFAARDHQDGFPFDGPGKTLAHTFFPAPPNPEPVAGDLHFDDDEIWEVGGSLDLYSVALHELGHALGLGHSDNPQAVMYPYYRKVTALHSEDVATIRELYESGTGSTATAPPATPTLLGLTISQPATDTTTTQGMSIAMSGAATGGSGAVTVSWINNRGGAGTAQGTLPWTIASLPLQAGDNFITITATDSARNAVSKVYRVVREVATSALTIRVTSPASTPTYTSPAPWVVLAGSAGPESAITRVFWATNRGAGGSVNGSSTWITGPVPLESGTTRITITAVGKQGETSSTVMDVAYTPTATDRLAPTLVITSPATTVSSTNAAAISLTGTASDNFQIKDIDWTSDSNRAGKAVGTFMWRIDNYPLVRGNNTILIRATDNAGNSSWQTVTITRN